MGGAPWGGSMGGLHGGAPCGREGGTCQSGKVQQVALAGRGAHTLHAGCAGRGGAHTLHAGCAGRGGAHTLRYTLAGRALARTLRGHHLDLLGVASDERATTLVQEEMNGLGLAQRDGSSLAIPAKRRAQRRAQRRGGAHAERGGGWWWCIVRSVFCMKEERAPVFFPRGGRQGRRERLPLRSGVIEKPSLGDRGQKKRRGQRRRAALGEKEVVARTG